MKTLFVLVTLAILSSGCLKTRSQLRGDDEDSGAPHPTQVTPVDNHAQGGYVVDELKGELIRLNGRIEDLERAQKQGSDQANQALRQDIQKIEARMNELEGTQREMLERMKTAEAVTMANPDELYARGKKQFDSGDFEGAVESFTNYLKNPKSKHSEDATFMRAESFFNLKQYKKAIVDYSKFPERFPRSHRMATVLYKTGMSFDALGLKDDAKSFYQELIDKHPKAPEAKRARAKLR